MKEARIKKVIAPVRIDFGGGTTDIYPFTHKHGGAVLNAGINRYISGSIIKNFSYANTLVNFTTSLSGANTTFSLTATQTAALAEGKFYFSLNYTQSDSVTVERLVEGLITVEASAEINNG